MNRKLIAACLFCAWPFGLAAQSDLGNTQASTPGLYLDVDGISEFRAANPSVDDQAVPDAPTPAKKSTLHGAVEGFTGLMLVNTPYAGLRDDLPVMDLGGSAGGELGRGRTSYFVSFDQFGLNQQKLDGFLMSLQGREGGGVMPIDLNPVSFSQLSASADKKFGQRD
ncbi:MAG: hypothetical protein WBL41_15510, partial [Terracidiphilus sp.]